MAIVFAAVAASAWPAHGQMTTPDLDVRGYSGPISSFTAPGAWLQRNITVANHSDSVREAKVVLQSSDSTGAPVQYYSIFRVPPHAARSTLMTLRGEHEPKKYGTAPDVVAEQAFIFDAATEAQMMQYTQPVRKLEPGQTVMAFLGGQDGRDTTGMFEHITQLGELRRVEGGNFANWPTSGTGYSRINILIARSLDMSSLRPTQRRALLDWVGQGGTLLLTGSPALPDMLCGELGRYAGVACLGVHTTESLAVSGLGSEKIVADCFWPVAMAELVNESADVLCWANDLPLLTRKTYGAGQVMVLAVPPIATEDSRLHEIWGLVGRKPAMVAAVSNDERFNAPARAALNEIAGRRGPRVAVPLAMLLGLAAAVTGAGLLLRLKRRGELLWAVLIPASVLGAAALWAAGQMQADDERLSYIGLITSIDDSSAKASQLVAYYSGHRRQTVTFGGVTDGALLTPISESAAGGLATGKLRAETAMAMPDVEVASNSTRSFAAEAVVRMAPVTSKLSFGPQGLQGEITNNLPTDIVDAVVYTGRGTYKLGVLPAGKATAVSIGDGQFLGPVQVIRSADGRERTMLADFTGKLVKDSTDLLRNRLVSQLAAPSDSPRTTAVLIGYASACPVGPLKDRQPPQQGWSVVAWPLNVRSAPPGTRVTVPAGFVELAIRGGGWSPLERTFLAAQAGQSATISASAPAACRQLADPAITLRLATRAPGYRLTVRGLVDDDKTVDVAAIDNPSRQVDVPVPQPERFLRNDAYRFVISLDLQGSFPDPTEAPTCEFSEISVILEGTTR